MDMKLVWIAAILTAVAAPIRAGLYGSDASVIRSLDHTSLETAVLGAPVGVGRSDNRKNCAK